MVNSNLGMNHEGIIPILVKTIQEQQIQIAELKSKIEKIEVRVDN